MMEHSDLLRQRVLRILQLAHYEDDPEVFVQEFLSRQIAQTLGFVLAQLSEADQQGLLREIEAGTRPAPDVFLQYATWEQLRAAARRAVDEGLLLVYQMAQERMPQVPPNERERLVWALEDLAELHSASPTQRE